MIPFQQMKPDNAELVSGDKTTSQLIYKDSDTNQLVIVPNIWYNQPESWQREAEKFYAEMRAREEARLRIAHQRAIYNYYLERKEWYFKCP